MLSSADKSVSLRLSQSLVITEIFFLCDVVLMCTVNVAKFRISLSSVSLSATWISSLRQISVVLISVLNQSENWFTFFALPLQNFIFVFAF